MAKSRRKSKHRGARRRRRRRRRQRGGGHLAATAAPYPSAAFAPPGGIYKPGSVNGLDGGYYYGVNVDQSLPDPISTSALFRQRGARRRRRGGRRTKRRRRGGRRTKRRRRGGRRTKRRRRGGRHTKHHRRRRRQRGGSWARWNWRTGVGRKVLHPPSFKRFLTTVVPKDISDMFYKGGNSVGNLYRGYVGDRPEMPPVPYTSQPINQPTNTLSYQPVDANNAYNAAIATVNKTNTPLAQSSY